MEEVIEVKNISKSFGAVQAVQNISFFLKKQEIMGLVGDNGAGKSTLLKILAGSHKPDEGKILINGQEAVINSPLDAQEAGIEIVYQDFMLAPNLDITSNLFLGRELTANWFIMKKMLKRKMRRQTKQTLTELGFEMDIDSIVSNLSGGQQQTVAISRAVHFKPNVVLMDEPTASLSLNAVNDVLERVKRMREHGASIIFVSHSLPEVLEITDRIVVLRRGNVVAELKTAETNLDEVVKHMTGSKIINH